MGIKVHSVARLVLTSDFRFWIVGAARDRRAAPLAEGDALASRANPPRHPSMGLDRVFLPVAPGGTGATPGTTPRHRQGNACDAGTNQKNEERDLRPGEEVHRGSNEGVVLP